MTELQIFVMELTLSMIEIQFVIHYYFYVYGVPCLNIKKICVISAALMFMVTGILRAVLAPIRPVSLPVITVLASLLLLPLFRTRWEKKVLFSFILIGVSSAWVLLSDLLVTPLPEKNIGVIYIVFHCIFWCILEAIKNIGKEEPQQLSRVAVLVKIADALSVQTDALIYDAPEVNRTVMAGEISDILSSCKPNELKIITDVIKSLKISLDKNND